MTRTADELSPAPAGRGARWTWLAAAVALAVGLAGPPGLAFLLLLVPLLADAARRPAGYAVEGDTLVVRRRAAPARRYPLTGDGRTRFHLTDRSRAVRAETADGAVLVSPEDPESFVAAARQR